MSRVPSNVPSLPPFSFFRMRRFLPQYIEEADWSRGMIRDAPRDSIPPGAFYDATDFMFDKPGIMYKRGGTAYSGPVLGASTYTKAVIYSDQFSKLLAVGSDNNIYNVTAGTSTSIGAWADNAGASKPRMYWTGTKAVLIGPGSAGKSYDNTTIANITAWNGASFIDVYKGRYCMDGGGQGGRKSRVYFAPSVGSTGIDVTNAWVDTTFAITGFAALQNALLVFSNRGIERITGSSPPSSTSTGDMSLAPIASIGTPWANSITVYNNTALFANTKGIYQTDGVSVKDLTSGGGIETYWRSLFTGNTQTVATGVLGNLFIVSVTDASSRAFTDCLCYYLPRGSWWRATNIPALMFAPSMGAGQEELYYAAGDVARVVQTSNFFVPASGNKNDANGTAVTPTFESREQTPGMGLKQYGLARLNFDMRDAATDNPSLAVKVSAGLEPLTFTAVAESPFTETTDDSRKKFTIAKSAEGVTLRFEQTNASSKTEIYGWEVETRPFSSEFGGIK